MESYTGEERRVSPSETIMLLNEIKQLAVIVSGIGTNVDLLREDFAETKKNMASCSDIERVEKKHSDHLIDHEKIKKESTETKRWSLGAAIAAASMLLPFIGSLFGWGKP